MAATKKKKDTAETSEVEMNSEELLKALEEKNKETEKLTKEKDEYLLIAQRLQADFDNFRKRNNSVREESYNEGIIDTIKKLLKGLFFNVAITDLTGGNLVSSVSISGLYFKKIPGINIEIPAKAPKIKLTIDQPV